MPTSAYVQLKLSLNIHFCQDAALMMLRVSRKFFPSMKTYKQDPSIENSQYIIPRGYKETVNTVWLKKAPYVMLRMFRFANKKKTRNVCL